MSNAFIDNISGSDGSSSVNFPYGLAFDTSILGATLATQLGLKEYTAGTDFTITAGSGTSITTLDYGYAIPRKDVSGNWWIKFGFSASVSTNTSGQVLISGIDTKGFSTSRQIVAVETNSADGSEAYTHSVGGGSADNAIRWISAGNVTAFRVSGDIKLASKPTWSTIA
jgi:hypothetical protein